MDDMISQVFGEWTVELYSHANRYGRWYLCKCSCGTEKVVLGVELRRGKTKSCGHSGSTFKHGFSKRGKKTPEYKIWITMRSRCNNPKVKSFMDYGGRGITVCDRWNSFEKFYEDMGDVPFPGATIERENNDKGYSPDNCRWASRHEQRRNSRRIISVTLNGKTMCLKDWCQELNLPYHRIYQRVHRGMTPLCALLGKEV